MSKSVNISSEDKSHVKDVRFVTLVGMLVNIFLAIFKITAGILGASQAVVADGVHSITDITTDIAILIGVKYWSAPPDDTHPHGHSRIETLITLMIGIILAFVAFGLIYNALITLTGEHTSPPKLVALYAAIVSIVSKEILYRWNIYVGRRIKSSAVIANAWHHRSDGLSSIPVAVAVIGARLLPGWYFLDHIGAIVVTVFILQASWSIIWPALKELTDTGASPEEYEQIIRLCESTDGVKEIHKVRTRQLGMGLQVDLHVLVDENLTVRKGHRIAAAVKYRLLEDGPDVVDVIVHLEPYKEKSQ